MPVRYLHRAVAPQVVPLGPGADGRWLALDWRTGELVATGTIGGDGCYGPEWRPEIADAGAIEDQVAEG